MTDKDGKFEFKNLEPGRYRYEAGVQGRDGFRAATIRLKPGEKKELEVKLVTQ